MVETIRNIALIADDDQDERKSVSDSLMREFDEVHTVVDPGHAREFLEYLHGSERPADEKYNIFVRSDGSMPRPSKDMEDSFNGGPKVPYDGDKDVAGILGLFKQPWDKINKFLITLFTGGDPRSQYGIKDCSGFAGFVDLNSYQANQTDESEIIGMRKGYETVENEKRVLARYKELIS